MPEDSWAGVLPHGARRLRARGLEQALHDRDQSIAASSCIIAIGRPICLYQVLKLASNFLSAASEIAMTNALAETSNGLYRAEVIDLRGLWRSFEAIEFTTAGMGGRDQQPAAPPSPSAGLPPAQAEQCYADQRYYGWNDRAMAA